MLKKVIVLTFALFLVGVSSDLIADVDYGSPFNGPHNMPGIIQAENFNNGGQYIAYYTPTPGNQGNSAYRTDVDVDIYEDGGIIYVRDAVSSTRDQWLNYTFEIDNAGWYKIRGNADVDSTSGGARRLVVAIDDRAIRCSYILIGEFTVYDLLDPVYLTAGTHVLKIEWSALDLCFDYFEFVESSEPNNGDPFVVEMDEEIIIADVNILDAPYYADNTGSVDCTAIIRDAFKYVENKGGGTVYLPAGLYKISTFLTMPANTTLCGDWKSPFDGGNSTGTILMAYYGQDNESATSFLRLAGNNACVRNLSIWYPEQDFNSPHAYPWTIDCLDGTAGYCIKNITLYNSYNGIYFRNSSAHTASNIYGTVLKKGYITSRGGQFSWGNNINFKSSFWKNAVSPIDNAPATQSERDALDSYITENLCGIQFSRHDGLYYDVTVENAETDILVEMLPEDEIYIPIWGALAKINGEIVETNGYPYENLHYLNIDYVPEVANRYYKSPAMRKPANPNIFINVKEHSAVGDGIADDTTAIQDALDDAGNSGGGTVYLPQGQYRINGNLNVPSGVELRGANGVCYTRMKMETTVLLAYDSNGTFSPDSDTAFITLDSNSGVRGLGIVYPEQGFGRESDPESIVQTYPFTIRGNGSGIWIVDLCLLNPYNAIDLATNRCDDHLISGVWGSSLNQGVKVGGGSTGGKVERMNLTRTVWGGSLRQKATHSYGGDDLRTQIIENNIAYAFGDCSGQQTFGLSSFNPHIGFYFYEDVNGCIDDSVFWFPSVDGAKENSTFLFEDGNTIDLIGAWASSDEYWLETTSSFPGTVNVYDRTIRDIMGCTNHQLIVGGTVNLFNEVSMTRDKAATASSYDGTSVTPDKAVDGSEETKWVDSSAGTKWLQVDLGQPSQIERWMIINAGLSEDPNYNTRAADIEYSLDGTTFIKTDGFVDNAHVVIDRPLDPNLARYVKLKILEGAQLGWANVARIYEFGVFGKEGWNFGGEGDTQGWAALQQISSINAIDRKLEITASGPDPAIISSDNLNIDTSKYKQLEVKMRNQTESDSGQIYFVTNDDTTWNEAKSESVTLVTSDPVYTHYIFDFSSNAGWNGILKQLRFDPIADQVGSVSIDYLRLVNVPEPVDTNFTNAMGDDFWHTPGNWDNGVPSSVDDAYIYAGNTANIVEAGAVANNLYFGSLDTPGHLRISPNATLAVASKLRIGADSVSVTNTMTMDGGTVTTVSTQLGNNADCTGILTMNSSDASLSSTNAIAVGVSGTGDVQMVDGTLRTDGQFVFGYNLSGTGTMTMSGGTVIANTFELGYNGEGTVTMTDGVINTGYLDVGRFDTGTGHLQLDGGVINVSINFRMRLRTSVGTVDITKGEIIINGNQVTAVTNYKNNGWLTAYGESDNVLIDYDNINPGKTTVKANVVCPSADLNDDCIINFEDLALLLAEWI